MDLPHRVLGSGLGSARALFMTLAAAPCAFSGPFGLPFELPMSGAILRPALAITGRAQGSIAPDPSSLVPEVPAVPPTPMKVAAITEGEANVLATLAVLEEPAGCPRLDVVQVVMNRIASPRWPNDVTRVAFQSGQFQPFFGISPSQVNSEAKAASLVSRKRRSSYAAALASLRQVKEEMQDPGLMRDSRDFVGGRTSFKGVSQYRNMWTEDVRRRHGCNFYHREKSQSWAMLKQNLGKAPDLVAVAR